MEGGCLMEKSYVTLIANLCLVCGKQFDTGELAIDRRLRPKFDMHTVMGMGLCEEHEKLYKDGYIALVEIDPAKTTRESNDTIKPENAWRTGPIAHIRGTVWEHIFDTPLPMGDSGMMRPAVFVEPGVIELLAARQAEAG
jgi:hypothetical protein